MTYPPIFEDRSKTCCFTGHRDLTLEEKYSCAEKLTRAADAFAKMGVTNFITGGALGFDTVAAVTLINLKRQKYPQFSIGVAVPFRDQSSRWSLQDRALYNTILKNADRVIILSEGYHRACMSVRNRYMVDNSKYCMAYLTKQSGGTYSTYRYASDKGLVLYNLASPVWDLKKEDKG